MRLGGKIIVSLWKVTGASTALLSGHLLNSKTNGQLQTHISRLRDFARSCSLVNRVPEPHAIDIKLQSGSVKVGLSGAYLLVVNKNSSSSIRQHPCKQASLMYCCPHSYGLLWVHGQCIAHFRYLTVIFLWTTHKRHPIAHPLGVGMGVCL